MENLTRYQGASGSTGMTATNRYFVTYSTGDEMMNEFNFEHQIFKHAGDCSRLYEAQEDEHKLSSTYETIGRIVMEAIWRGETLLIAFPSLKGSSQQEDEEQIE